MKRSTSCSVVSVVVLLAMLGGLIPHAAAASGDALLTMIPDDAMFCVRINQLNTTLGKMDQYLAGASPMPVSLIMLVNMQLAGIVGDPMLTGIDKNGTFMAVGFVGDDENQTIEMSFLVPMADYETFIKNNPLCSASNSPGITLLKSANSVVGTLAMMPAPGGKYAIVNPEAELDALVAFQKKVTSSKPGLSARLNAAESARAASDPAWIYANLAGIYDLFGPVLLERIDQMQTELPQDQMMGGAMQMNFKFLSELVKLFVGQADMLTLSLLPEPAVLNMDISFKAKDGSELAGMLVADPQEAADFTLAGYADDTTAVNAVMKLNRPLLEKLTARMYDILAVAADGNTLTAELQNFKSLTEKSFKAMGKEAFFAFSYGAGQPPFMMRQVQYVNEPDFFKTIGREGIDAVNGFYKAVNLPFTFTYEPGVDTYQNVSIDAFKLNVENKTGDNSLEMLQKLYGPEGLSYYSAQKDKMLFIAFGPTSKADLKTMIGAPAGNAPAGDLQKAMSVLGTSVGQADAVISVNYLKLIKGFLGMAQQMGEGFSPGPAEAGIFAGLSAAMNIQTQSCLAVRADIAGGKITSRMALPKQHLTEIVTAVMQVQAQMMQQMQAQGGMGGMQPQPVPPVSPFSPQPRPQQPTAQPQDPLQAWVGKAAPDMSLTDLQGNKTSIADLKGKKVILDFWATWCPPCKEMIPDLIKLRDSYDGAKLAILGVSNEPVDRLNKFAKDYKMNYPVIPLSGAMPDPYGKVTALPTTFLIDSTGTIRHILVGYHELNDLKAALDGMQ